jgi:hypothetical protein
MSFPGVQSPDLRLRTFLRLAYTSRAGFVVGLAAVAAFGSAEIVRGDWVVVVIALSAAVLFVALLYLLWRRNGGRQVRLRR